MKTLVEQLLSLVTWQPSYIYSNCLEVEAHVVLTVTIDIIAQRKRQYAQELASHTLRQWVSSRQFTETEAQKRNCNIPRGKQYRGEEGTSKGPNRTEGQNLESHCRSLPQ